MENREIQHRQGLVRGIPEDSDGRTITFVISDESRDRHKSIIPLDAWDLKAFRNNPVAGWSHEVYGGGFFSKPDPDNFIGSWSNLRMEEGEFLGDLTYEDKETNPLADKLLRKTRNGTISSVSVGFMGGEGHYGTKDDKEDRGGEKETYYYDYAELAEVSLVGIGSNRNARKKAFENGDIPLEELIKEALGDKFNETMTLKGLFATLSGGDGGEVLEADTGRKVNYKLLKAKINLKQRQDGDNSEAL